MKSAETPLPDCPRPPFGLPLRPLYTSRRVLSYTNATPRRIIGQTLADIYASVMSNTKRCLHVTHKVTHKILRSQVPRVCVCVCERDCREIKMPAETKSSPE